MTFTESYIKKMDALKAERKFYDSELRSKVNEKIYELSEKDELPEEIMDLLSASDDTNDDDEYWTIYHLIADSILNDAAKMDNSIYYGLPEDADAFGGGKY